MDSEVVDHALRTTRSVRRKLDLGKPVPASLLEDCIDVATQAPTGLQRESWRFVVVTDPEPKRALGALYLETFEEMISRWRELPGPGDASKRPTLGRGYRELAERLHEFPALVLVCSLGTPGPDPALQVAFYGSVLPAAWSLMVSLRARGLGTTWTTLLTRRGPEVARVLGVPDDVTQTVLLPVAWTRDAVLRPAQRKPAAEVTFWNAWGRSRD